MKDLAMTRCDHDLELNQKRLFDNTRSLREQYPSLADDGREIRIAPCPYADEIHNVQNPCACCDECRHNCAMEI